MAGVLLLAFATFIISAIHFLLQWYRTYQRRAGIKTQHKCLPPSYYPHIDPFGIDYLVSSFRAVKESKLLEKCDEDLIKYGSTYQLNFLGYPMIMTKEPAIVKACMADSFSDWGVAPVRYDAFLPFLGRSFFILDGPEWKHGRQLARPALAKNEYGDLARLEQHVKLFLKLLPRDGSTVNLREYFQRLSISFSRDYFLGQQSHILSPVGMSVKDQEFVEANEACMVHLEKRMLMGPLTKVLPAEKEFLKHARTIHASLDESIEKAVTDNADSEKQSISSRKAFLQQMISQTEDRTIIRDAALTMYLVGKDTSTTTLTAIFWVLARHPEVVMKLRAEIQETSPGLPELGTLDKMIYTKAVVKEAMRLYGFTSAPNFRAALTDTVLPAGGGPDGKSPLFVKKGTILVLQIRAMHRDPRWWGEDASDFRPERFLESSRLDNVWALQLFGGGPRKCPGQNLGFTNACYVLVRLLQTFKKVEQRDYRPWTELMKGGVESLYGAEVGLIPA